MKVVAKPLNLTIEWGEQIRKVVAIGRRALENEAIVFVRYMC